MAPSATLSHDQTLAMLEKDSQIHKIDKLLQSPRKQNSNTSGLDASKLQFSFTQNPKKIPALDSHDVRTIRACTDHMITVSWTVEEGWAAPQLVPYGPIALMPSASALQYATECFEGMKVFRGHDGKLRLFRPMHNCRRMLTSVDRISLPSFDPDELLKLILKFCSVECPKWLPRDQTGSYLYLRPSMIGTDPSLGAEPPKSAMLMIFMAFWPAAKPHRSLTTDVSSKARSHSGLWLLASQENEVRAWPGGTGFAKVGANYGPALCALKVAQEQGYDQVLWLFGNDHQVTEAGSTNFFAIWRSKEDGKLQMLTSPLDTGLILAGVTRQSILDLARERFAADKRWKSVDGNTPQVEPLEVIERTFTMSELLAAAAEDRFEAVFTVGTAYFVNPVSRIQFQNREIDIVMDKLPHIAMLRQWMTDIMFGIEKNPWTLEVAETT